MFHCFQFKINVVLTVSSLLSSSFNNAVYVSIGCSSNLAHAHFPLHPSLSHVFWWYFFWHCLNYIKLLKNKNKTGSLSLNCNPSLNVFILLSSLYYFDVSDFPQPNLYLNVPLAFKLGYINVPPLLSLFFHYKSLSLKQVPLFSLTLSSNFLSIYHRLIHCTHSDPGLFEVKKWILYKTPL